MRVVLVIIGFISLLLGMLGIFLPVLPTVPFLLLSSWCFAKGSDKFYKWFISTKIYKKQLESAVIKTKDSKKSESISEDVS